MMNADFQLAEIKDRIDPDSKFDIGMSLHKINIINDCQKVIETYVKAMFKLVEVNPPAEHSLDFNHDRTKGFLHADFPDEFESEGDLPRCIFLTHFWEEFYTETKYGYPEMDLAPSDLFDIDDAKRAIEHAEFVQEVGTELRKAVEEENEED